MKKYCLPVCLLLFLVACRSKEETKDNPTSTPKLENSQQSEPVATYTSYVSVDVSPMDMSYFPADYPKLKSNQTAPKEPLARIIYSRPHLNGRKLFPDIVKYNEPWRLGANESTEIEFFTDVMIQHKKIAKGKYVLYCIPYVENWKLILNSNLYSWGLHPDTSKDTAGFTISLKKLDLQLEYLSIVFEGRDKKAELVISWDSSEARLPILFI